jgi:uncharacterized protein YvpB
MVAVARQHESASPSPAVAESRLPISDHLLQPKKSPIAQKLAQQEAERLMRSRFIARQKSAVDQSLRKVDVDGPALVEYARPALIAGNDAGIVGAYASRARRVRRPGPRASALIAEPVAIGRASRTHFDRVARARRPALPRMGLPAARLNMAGRMAIASLAAVMIVLAGFGAAFAQSRYEVQDGDTLESVADEFGVDPAAIAASSWMPNGDTLEAGQVIVIPEVGQTPEEAAATAAELEGTSPWVVGAHTVAEGETLDGIGAPYGVAGAQIAEFNGIEDVANVIPGTHVLIPAVPTDDTGSVDASEIEIAPAVALDVPFFQQTRNLSCEYAASYIATSYFGAGVTEETFIASVPLTLNPHHGYRGNINGLWGNTTDYGIYPEALAPILADNGFVAETFYGMGDTSQITAQLDAGRPVVVWLGMWGDTREHLSDDGEYSVASGMHVMTAYGYSTDGIFLADPATGSEKYYDWATFTAMWTVLDGMSMAVYPEG